MKPFFRFGYIYGFVMLLTGFIIYKTHVNKSSLVVVLLKEAYVAN
jgi:hypothetical protein